VVTHAVKPCYLHHSVGRHSRPTRQHFRWDDRQKLPLAIGLHSAYELTGRDLEALLAMERDPPEYLAHELGAVPEGTQGRAAWRDGARLIERYRAECNVDYPTAALAPLALSLPTSIHVRRALVAVTPRPWVGPTSKPPVRSPWFVRAT
jgi:hypothetical protein